MDAPYTPPERRLSTFNCPHCLAYAQQTWSPVYFTHWGSNHQTIPEFDSGFCSHCSNFTIWWNETMVYPHSTSVSPPNSDLDDDIRDDYNEAARILDQSARGAAALLRLSLQKLCVQLGETGKNINDDIKALVAKGLPPMVQQALDVVRVVGNNAVHPGQIDLRDDRETAKRLFELINLVATIMISQPKQVDALYQSLPQNARQGIATRDSSQT